MFVRGLRTGQTYIHGLLWNTPLEYFLVDWAATASLRLDWAATASLGDAATVALGDCRALLRIRHERNNKERLELSLNELRL